MVNDGVVVLLSVTHVAVVVVAIFFMFLGAVVRKRIWARILACSKGGGTYSTALKRLLPQVKASRRKNMGPAQATGASAGSVAYDAQDASR